MKEFRLSTTADRIVGSCTAVGTIAALGLLLYALRSNIAMLIFCGLLSLPIIAALIVYAANVFRAVCIADAETKTLRVRGITNYTVDVSEAVLLQTVGRKKGQSAARVLVFSGSEEQIIATVPTMHTLRQGIWADPMARELAEYLGIEFQQNVPDWQLDRKKYQEHIKEEEARQRKEAKERREKKAQMRIQKFKNRK